MKTIWRDKEVCTCMCHEHGGAMMHMMPCCNLTYEIYIGKDHKIIDSELESAFKKLEEYKENKGS